MSNPQKPQDWNETANGNTSINTISVAEFCAYANLNDAIREMMASIRSELASAGTIASATLTDASSIGEFKQLTGSVTVDGFSTAVTGTYREIRVLGAPLIKSSSAIVTPNGANYQAAADDTLRLRSLGAGNWFMTAQPKSGLTLGKHMLPVLAQALTPATTNGPSSGQTETATNKVNYPTLDHDATTAESSWIAFPAPTGWDTTRGFTFEVDWDYAATATGAGVAWSLAILAVSDGDTLDAAAGTAITITDAKLGSGVKHTTAESATVTPSGSWAAGDTLFAKIARVPSDAADLVTADARLIAVRLFTYTNTATDTTP